jgi:hypothetical protein
MDRAARRRAGAEILLPDGQRVDQMPGTETHACMLS